MDDTEDYASSMSQCECKTPRAAGNDPSKLMPGVVTAGAVATDIRPEDDGRAALPCLMGPCRYYSTIGQVLGVVSGTEHIKEYRYCKLLSEFSGTMTLQELTIRFCTDYAPPWWSLSGWWQRLRMAPLQIESASKFHYKAKGLVTILFWLNRVLDDHAPEPTWVAKAEAQLDMDKKQDAKRSKQ